MPSSVSNCRAFLKSLRRRMILSQVVLRSGILLFCTSLSAILILPLSLWGFATLAAAVTAISGIAIMVTAVLVFRRWPTLLSAAAIADRQLHLDDLLTTTVRLQPVPFDDLSEVVIALADARCRQVPVTAIAIPGLSGTSWAGIALAAAAAIALAVVPMRSANSSHSNADSNVLASAVDAPGEGASPLISVGVPFHSDPIGEGESRMSAPMESAGSEKNTVTPDGAADSENHAAEGGGDASTGRRASSTQKPLANQAPDVSSTGGHRTHSSGIASGSGREATEHRDATGDKIGEGAGMTAGQTARSESVPAWSSPDWPAARAVALSPARAATIPAAYRDLVRDYFQ
jgi:hypothetical protein